MLRKWREEAKGTRVINEYGPTETVVGCLVKEVEEEGEEDAMESIGRPIANVRVYIVNESEQLAPIGVEGEICIAGAGVGRGYVGRSEETAEKFVPDEYGGEAGGRMYRSGDLGSWSERGEVEYLGRRDRQVKLRGYRIELGEIESALREQEGVEQGVVEVRSVEGVGKQLVGYAVVGGE